MFGSLAVVVEYSSGSHQLFSLCSAVERSSISSWALCRCKREEYGTLEVTLFCRSSWCRRTLLYLSATLYITLAMIPKDQRISVEVGNLHLLLPAGCSPFFSSASALLLRCGDARYLCRAICRCRATITDILHAYCMFARCRS